MSACNKNQQSYQEKIKQKLIVEIFYIKIQIFYFFADIILNDDEVFIIIITITSFINICFA